MALNLANRTPPGGPAVLSYLQAVVIGLAQGVTELFPISSLGHSELIPAPGRRAVAAPS